MGRVSVLSLFFALLVAGSFPLPCGDRDEHRFDSLLDSDLHDLESNLVGKLAQVHCLLVHDQHEIEVVVLRGHLGNRFSREEADFAAD